MNQDKFEKAEKLLKEAATLNIDMLDTLDQLHVEWFTSSDLTKEFKKMLIEQIKDVKRCKKPEDFYYLISRRGY